MQPAAVCLISLIGAVNRLASGEWKAGLVLLGVGALFLFLLRGAVLWYRFGDDSLVIQRWSGRERHKWTDLRFATVKDTVLAMSFGAGELVGIDGSQITRSPEDIFISMQGYWSKQVPSSLQGARQVDIRWSWLKASFWWLIVPTLVLIAFPAVIDSLRQKLGVWAPLCENVPTPEGPCTTLRHLTALLHLDFAVLFLMLLVVAAIHSTGEYCNRHRHKLLSVFPATLVVAIVSAILILTTQGVLLAALLYYVPLELAGRQLSGLLISIAIALVLGLYNVARHAWSALNPPPFEVDAISVLKSEEPQIWEVASSIAQLLGAPPPDNILLGLEPNYFVTESRLSVNGMQADGYSLYISVPATRLMTTPELRAIVGHEFGHFRGADTAFTKRFFPLYNSAAKALAGMANAYGSWALSPAIYMLHFFLFSFGKVQAALSRDREFLADNAGAEASSPRDLASALVKLHLFAPAISALIDERVYTDRASTALGEHICFSWPSPIPESLLEARTPHPFDSHPPLGTRLENLGIQLKTVLSVPVSNQTPGVFEAPDRLEARLITALRLKAEASSLSRRFTFVPGVPPATPGLRTSVNATLNKTQARWNC